MNPADPYRASAGAYVLGALDAGERTAFEDHLRVCAECRHDVAQLAPLPALMRSLPPPNPAASDATTETSQLTALAAVARRVAGRRRRTRRAALGAVVTAAAAAAAAVLATSTPPSTPATHGRLIALEGSRAAGTAELDNRAWGTQMLLTLSGLPPGDPATATVTGSSGAAERAGNWTSPPNGRAVLELATKVPAGSITSVTVTDMRTGRTIMRSRFPGH